MESDEAEENLIAYVSALEQYYLSSGTNGPLADGGIS